MPDTREAPTAVMPQLNGPLPPTPSTPSNRRWIPWTIAGAALALVLAGAAIILISQDNTKSTAQSAAAATTVYQSKLSTTITPVVSANRTLSQTLQTVDGSKPTLRAATNATQAAQAQTVAARGAIAVLTVPISQQQLTQQATQALTQETGYLQAVSSTLSDPTGSAPSSLQPLASATSSAFVPLANVAPGGASSISGIENLQSWTSGAKSATNRKKPPPQVINKTTVVTPPTAITPPVTQSAPDGGTRLVADTVGRPTISAGSSVSDGFARNILIAAADYQANGVLPENVTLSVSSPTTGGTYNVNYTNDGSTVYATNLDGSSSSGNDVSFPASDANGTG
jgi:hypothetical protein